MRPLNILKCVIALPEVPLRHEMQKILKNMF